MCGRCFYEASRCKCRMLNSFVLCCPYCKTCVEGDGEAGATVNLELHITEEHPPKIDQLSFVDMIMDLTVQDLLSACLPEEYHEIEKTRDKLLKGWK